MSATADHAENLAARLGFQSEQVVQEIGYDDDVDQDFRDVVDELVGDLVDEDYDDVADAVLLWFREDDGDLADTLVDATELIEDGALILLLTPKTGRPGYVEASDIKEAAETAGLSLAKGAPVGKEWAATKLVTPKTAVKPKR
ncbi:DUF3052 domain-containing protein [Streptomyces xanthophaeus]|uniref:DUF3052 domain-containing protein n=1 Tax=Streptomyces xanthophaeus TaxID=67385 RepID=A0A919H655_9ACTN|nr:DUF3052 domain-containing protein [Streptomyces xanthophaeus]WCD86250.1 hypothetical protein KPP03845_102593 [Streptomyces xanthophaeus]WST22318.1 DUF3052 domain-containing protein [Streptomyces xanthophaeus]WST62707.1 DUF3052 domain-containing protein [Streptomyces xanthophaeus]GHI89857.1 hypothetical protein Sxan_72210 [Streptomyces xanthophaeus]